VSELQTAPGVSPEASAVHGSHVRRSWIAEAGLGLAVSLAVLMTTGFVTGTAVMAMVLGCSAVAWSDVKYRRIPNAVVAAMVLAATAGTALSESASVGTVVAGAVSASLTLLVLHLMNPRWVGFGDVKFSFAVGCLLGLLWWPVGVAVLWLASFAAVVSRPFVPNEWRRSVPFGFWLAVAAVPVTIYSAIWVVQ
jgi:hypothetical protein